MRSKSQTWTVLAILAVGVILLIAWLTWRPKPENDGPPPLRVAWMTSWATTGQIMEALIHTDIIEEQSLNVEFRSFLFGPPMNEAALSGDADVTIVGDMPAISLLGASDDWTVVSRTIYFPYALIVRSDVEASSLADLKGRTVGVPFGAGPQPTLYHWIEEEGFEIGKEIKVINVLPNELAEAIITKRIDAAMAWEPALTTLLDNGDARILREARGVGFMCMSNRFVKNYPEVVDGFIEAWRRALFYVAQHPDEANAWFAEDSRFPVDLLERIRVVDPNFDAGSLRDVDVTLTPDDIERNQRKADFAYEQGLIKRRLNIAERLR